ncbi:MAG: hypothetical protein H7Y00_08680, partial [Fimbriimonadaceae bacterium]|nr:hypothetical protein [Chitinophagales bacterium]
MMKSKLFFLIAVINIFVACKTKSEAETNPSEIEKSVSETKEEKTEDKKVEPPVNYTYKKIINTRYNFSFEIPDVWKAADKS